MGFILILCLEGVAMLAIYTAFKKWQAKRKAAIKEMERLNRALKAQIYDLKEEERKK